MYEIEVTNQFLKDLKLARKRNLDENKLNDIVRLLAEGNPIPEKNRDHPLVGDYKGCRECHVTPDWLLIYSIENTLKIITLIRTGSHSDLF